jgi:hypothetical protein
LKSNIQQEIYLLCFKQEINEESWVDNQDQESWVENQNQDRFDTFSEIKLAKLKSCTQYTAKVELMFNNEPVKASDDQPIPSIPTPEFWTKPDIFIWPELKLISQTEDSADFELKG